MGWIISEVPSAHKKMPKSVQFGLHKDVSLFACELKKQELTRLSRAFSILKRNEKYNFARESDIKNTFYWVNWYNRWAVFAKKLHALSPVHLDVSQYPHFYWSVVLENSLGKIEFYVWNKELYFLTFPADF